MILEEISFLNVRKLKTFSQKLSENTTIITGKNGKGKTSILEAIFFLLTTKSFRKKYNKSIINENEELLQIKGVIKKDKRETIKTTYNGKIKKIEINNTVIKKTSQLLPYCNIVSASPEEVDVVETHRGEKVKYFDRICFKTTKGYVEEINKYNKLLKIRNKLLEENKETTEWDNQTAETGIKIWKKRSSFLKEIIKQFKITEKEIIEKNIYEIEYKNKKTKEKKEYIKEISQKNPYKKTIFGPHKDNLLFKLKGSQLQDTGSQGEKKLFKYILKLAEAEVLRRENNTNPIILLDDFFAKFDDENIMKIFTFFHRKFQTIITTTTIKDTAMEKKIKKSQKNSVKTIEVNDKTI